MGVVTADTGIGAGFDIAMGCKEFCSTGMTICAEQSRPLAEHPRFIRAVGLMALETVCYSRFVDDSVTPVTGNLSMAAETDDGLSLFEDIIMG